MPVPTHFTKRFLWFVIRKTQLKVSKEIWFYTVPVWDLIMLPIDILLGLYLKITKSFCCSLDNNLPFFFFFLPMIITCLEKNKVFCKMQVLVVNISFLSMWKLYLNFVIGWRQCFGKRLEKLYKKRLYLNFKFLLNIKIWIYSLHFLAEICVLYWTYIVRWIKK